MDQMLIELFGLGWTNLLQQGVESDSVASVLGVLFGLFNVAVAAVTVGALVFMALTAIGDTAQTGRLAKEGSSMWAPVRMVVAAAMLMPVVKGYSLLQVLLLSVVVKSSLGLANTMATEVAGYLVTDNGTMEAPIAAQVDGMAEQMLYSSVCMAYYNQIDYDVTQGGAGAILAVESRERVGGQLRRRWSFNGDAYSGQGEAACGAYLVTCPGDEPDTVSQCDAQWNALKGLKQDTDMIAQAIIDGYTLDVAAVAEAELAFQAKLQRAFEQRLGRLDRDAQHEEAGRTLVNRIENGGFVLLGQWYMTLAAINHRTMQSAQAMIDTLPIDQSKAIEHRLGYYAYHQRAQAALRLKPRAIENTQGARSEALQRQREMAGLLGHPGALGHFLTEPWRRLKGNEAVTSLFDFAGNPLQALQQLGNAMVSLTTHFWSKDRIPGVVVQFSDREQQWLTAAGSAADVISTESKDAVSNQMSTFASYIMIILFLGGLSLMYYLPAIPFIVWAFAVVGYLILVLESLLAAPLWAASHAMPRGRGLVSDASRQGYILLLNLAVRPPLMVMGLIAGGVVMLVCAQFAMSAFDVYSASLLQLRVENSALLSFAALFIVLVIILIGLVHKSFALIYEASDKVVEWVSGQSRASSVAGDETRASSASSGAQRSGEAALGRASYAASRRPMASTGVDPASQQTLR